eukprot:356133-Chlamydomonas_euryale.AAC.33
MVGSERRHVRRQHPPLQRLRILHLILRAVEGRGPQSVDSTQARHNTATWTGNQADCQWRCLVWCLVRDNRVVPKLRHDVKMPRCDLMPDVRSTGRHRLLCVPTWSSKSAASVAAEAMVSLSSFPSSWSRPCNTWRYRNSASSSLPCGTTHNTKSIAKAASGNQTADQLCWTKLLTACSTTTTATVPVHTMACRVAAKPYHFQEIAHPFQPPSLYPPQNDLPTCAPAASPPVRPSRRWLRPPQHKSPQKYTPTPARAASLSGRPPFRWSLPGPPLFPP